jgi:hypothetical protein
MEIDNRQAADWVESEDWLKITTGGDTTAFLEHREIDEDGDLSPAYPPRATPQNSTLISPFEITLTADAQVVADGTDEAVVELSTDASQPRTVELRVDSEKVGSYQVAPTDTITERITTTVPTREIVVEAVGEGVFREQAKIQAVAP